MSYGAVRDDIMVEYYQQPQPRKTQAVNAKHKSSYSSNAASIDCYIEMNDAILPSAPYREENEHEPGQRLHWNEFDIDIAAEPRDVYKANHMEMGSAPSDNLKCLWISILLLFIFIIASALCIDKYILDIYGTSSVSGNYYWSFGWSNAIFHPDDTTLNADEVPLQFVTRYAIDAGRFYIISILLMIVCLIPAMIILCSRCTNEVYLYVLCCNIRVPQTPALYILLSTLDQYAKMALSLYIVVMVYGMLEMNYYLMFLCQSTLGGTCTSFAVPHVGVLSLFMISFIIHCFVHKRVNRLDKGFNRRTIRYFYPDYIGKMNAKNVNINWSHLKAALDKVRMIIVCASVMYITFHNTGLILIGDRDKNTQSFSLYFQFQGLVNDKGLKYDTIPDADNFVLLCWAFYHIVLPFMLIFNGLLLCYFYYVIVTLNCIGFCKFIVITLMFMEWMLFTIISALYYYTFYLFWNSYLKDNREQPMYYNPDKSYDVFWCPDWGILLILAIDWYLLKLIRHTFKSI